MHSINPSVSFHGRLISGLLFSGDSSETLSRSYMDYLCFRTLCCKGPPPPRPEYDVVCIGLTGSGKTSLLSRLCSEATDNIVPTTGADSIKKYWSRYYQGSQGVVFVLDSASSEEDLEVARTELHSALQHPQLCTLPFLILANHQDKPAARSVQEKVFINAPSTPHTPYGALCMMDGCTFWASKSLPVKLGRARTFCKKLLYSYDSLRVSKSWGNFHF
ncbi:ADP-ribosylation factor-like protein 15 isoform X3 [Puntigrus tetrazona]|uniref:ADP-ribosylation factor-like protein 15 isoform X3 n=1 Tax=Puntigrus tetrazona TaxID=1606681 RepID=UPI001C89326A|nr:ADP-ribosylation factor-like protein 15 isoform X3 [Puntigrus tetrazona]